MNVDLDEKGKIPRWAYVSVLKYMNAERQKKIQGLHDFKRNKTMVISLPPSTYSYCVTGIKKSIAEDDKKIADFKQQYADQFQPKILLEAEKLLNEMSEALKSAQYYVKDYATKNADGHSAGLLNLVKQQLEKVEQYFKDK